VASPAGFTSPACSEGGPLRAMPLLPRALELVMAELGKLPGIGRRSAERMAFALLNAGQDRCEALEKSIGRLIEEVGICPQCGFFTDDGVCPIDADAHRDRTLLCVVEDAMDVVAFERAGGYRGLYHVLGGVLSPLKGVSPEDLRIALLFERLEHADSRIEEVILATSPSVEGDATAVYLAREMAALGLRITRLGRGLPMGGSLEHADGGTLRMAFEGRRSMD
jgi:recombination protein RecR